LQGREQGSPPGPALLTPGGCALPEDCNDSTTLTAYAAFKHRESTRAETRQIIQYLHRISTVKECCYALKAFGG